MMFLFGLAHLFIYVNISLAFNLRGLTRAILGIFIACAAFSWPILKTHKIPLLHWILGSWIGLAYFLTIFLVIIDIFWILWLVGRSFTQEKPLFRKLVCTALICTAILSGYSLYMAQNPRIVTIPIYSPLLEANATPLRIAFLSDIHIAPTYRAVALQKLVDAVQAQQPDIIILGGDIIGDEPHYFPEDAACMRNMTAPYGKYAVTGNHEEIHAAAVLPFFAASGFQLLHGITIDVAGIRIIGVDDRNFGGYFGHRTNALPALQAQPHDRFVLLIKHRPDIAPEELGLFDLQLSGHSHGGQVWPVGHLIATHILHAPATGLHDYEKSKLYLSPGIGYYLVPMRFLAAPEITIIEIHPETSAEVVASAIN